MTLQYSLKYYLLNIKGFFSSKLSKVFNVFHLHIILGPRWRLRIGERERWERSLSSPVTSVISLLRIGEREREGGEKPHFCGDLCDITTEGRRER